MGSYRSPLTAALSPEARGIVRQLQTEIAQQQQTVDELKAAGHLTADAEKYLQHLKGSLDLLR